MTCQMSRHVLFRHFHQLIPPTPRRRDTKALDLVDQAAQAGFASKIMDTQIDAIYEPAKGCPDDWKGGLQINGDRLEEYLAESPVLASIQTAGEHLLHARRIIKDLESSGTASKDMDDAIADELCKAMSRYCRTPAMRFFNSLLITKQPFLQAVMKRGPKKFSELPWTDAQYNAQVTYCFLAQVMHMNQKSEDSTREIVRCMDACIKARPDDATVYVMFGNWLMINGFMQDAVEHLEKAVKLDEDACFGSYYTIANICQNAVDVKKANQSGILDAFRAKHFMEKGIDNLRRYLKLAPIGHWQAHRACMSLVLTNATIKAVGESDTLSSIESRHPGFCIESESFFKRGVEALQLYENCFGEEHSDFKNQYEQAASLIAEMHSTDLLEGNFEKPRAIDYICAYPPCNESRWTENGPDEGTSTKLCVRCFSVSYCSKNCQVSSTSASVETIIPTHI